MVVAKFYFPKVVEGLTYYPVYDPVEQTSDKDGTLVGSLIQARALQIPSRRPGRAPILGSGMLLTI